MCLHRMVKRDEMRPWAEVRARGNPGKVRADDMEPSVLAMRMDGQSRSHGATEPTARDGGSCSSCDCRTERRVALLPSSST